jgi:hypothetical protein
MTKEEKILLAIEKGYTYNLETGVVTGVSGKEISKKIKGYITIQIHFEHKKYYLNAHQFAWYWVHKEYVEQIDHINGIKSDNRICNLRSVTIQQNHMNRTTAKGYCWDKQYNKWRAKITFNNKNIYLGRFEKEEDARAAYLEAKEKYHIID